MMHAVAARAAASAAAAAALVASATALASRASTSVRGARLACSRRGKLCWRREFLGRWPACWPVHGEACRRPAGHSQAMSPAVGQGEPPAHLERVDAPQQIQPLLLQPSQLHLGGIDDSNCTLFRAAALCRPSWHGRLGHAWPAASPCSARPRPAAHLQLAVAVQLVVQPPLLDCVHDQAAAQGHARIWRRLATVQAGPSKRDDSHAGTWHTPGNMISTWRHMDGGLRAVLLCHARPITQGQPVPPAADQATPPHLLHRRRQLRPRRLERLLYRLDGGP